MIRKCLFIRELLLQKPCYPTKTPCIRRLHGLPQDVDLAPCRDEVFRRLHEKTAPLGRSCHQLHNATGLLYLLLREARDPSSAHNEGDFRKPALAQSFEMSAMVEDSNRGCLQLGVAQGQKVESDGGILLLAADVGVANLLGDERPELQGRLVDTSTSLRSIPISENGMI